MYNAKKMRKIKIKLILIQILALMFLIAAVQRLYVSFQADKYEAIMASDWQKFESLTSLTVGGLFYEEILWGLVGLFLGTILIGYINWKNKAPLINTVLTFVTVLILFQIGFFSGGAARHYVDAIWESMALDYRLTYLIAGLVFGLISLTLFLKSFKKSTIHNNA